MATQTSYMLPGGLVEHENVSGLEISDCAHGVGILLVISGQNMVNFTSLYNRLCKRDANTRFLCNQPLVQTRACRM